jgi:hypothetical protein
MRWRLQQLVPRWVPTGRRGRFAALGAAVGVVALLAGGTAYGMVATGDDAPPATHAATATALTANTPTGCNTTPKKGFVRCLSVVRTAPDHEIVPNDSGPRPSSLSPADIQSAYRLPATGGQTVAIVDAMGYSSAEEDLATYRDHYGLPPCTTANGCFTKVDQRGGTQYPADDPGWAMETALDIDAVSAACPTCSILLVESDDASVENMGAAVDKAVELGAKYVSNSYGIAGEFADEAAYDHFYDHPGVVVTASSGDDGNVTNWPATSDKVVSIGGTRLTRDGSTARGWTESAWAEAGSGCSPYEPKPEFQHAVDTGCDRRASADLAAVADPASGLAVYDTLGYDGWLQVGGTSLSSPLVAAMYALAGPPAADTYPVSYPYHDPQRSDHLFDVTTGTNGTCGNVLCTAGVGWDGPTGLGTPNGVAALSGGPHGDIVGHVTDAATGTPVAGMTIKASPGGYQTRTGSDGGFDLNVAAGRYDLSASRYGYRTATKDGVEVGDGERVAADLSMTPLPHATLRGRVTDGSGHGWGLYARITIDGYPEGPIYTDPATGRYQLELPAPATYSLHVDAAGPAVATVTDGYQAKDAEVELAADGSTRDVALSADLAECSAPGYGRGGSTQTFDTFTGTRPGSGWTVSGRGWRFDNPADRPPAPGGNDVFAVADSGAGGHRLSTTLTSPVVDLSGQRSPTLRFDSAYYAGAGQRAAVELSTDGGKRWKSLWRKGSSNAIGTVELALPSAAKARVRFDFTGRRAGWWSLDDVAIGAGDCTAQPGGLLVGTVTNADDHGSIDGARIGPDGDPATSAVSAATGDKAVPNYYALFLPAGSRALTATRDGYATASRTVTVESGRVSRYDWTLEPAGGTR